MNDLRKLALEWARNDEGTVGVMCHRNVIERAELYARWMNGAELRPGPITDEDMKVKS